MGYPPCLCSCRMSCWNGALASWQSESDSEKVCCFSGPPARQGGVEILWKTVWFQECGRPFAGYVSLGSLVSFDLSRKFLGETFRLFFSNKLGIPRHFMKD